MVGARPLREVPVLTVSAIVPAPELIISSPTCSVTSKPVISFPLEMGAEIVTCVWHVPTTPLLSIAIQVIVVTVPTRYASVSAKPSLREPTTVFTPQASIAVGGVSVSI